MNDYILIDNILRLPGVRGFEVSKIFNEELDIEFIDFKIFFTNADKTEFWSKRIQVQTELMYSNPTAVHKYIMAKLAEEPVSALTKEMVE